MYLIELPKSLVVKQLATRIMNQCTYFPNASRLAKSFFNRLMINLIPIWLRLDSTKPLLQISFEKSRFDGDVTHGKTIDIANDFPIRVYPSRMIIAMLRVLDRKTVPEDMIIELLEIMTVFIFTGSRRWLRIGERAAVDNGMLAEGVPFFRGAGSFETFVKKFRDVGVVKWTCTRLFESKEGCKVTDISDFNKLRHVGENLISDKIQRCDLYIAKLWF